MGWNDHVIDIIRQGRKRSEKQEEVVKEAEQPKQVKLPESEKVEKQLKKSPPQEPIEDSESE